jgi:putative phosphoesterase
LLYAVISDIHANIQALTAVVEHIKSVKPDKIICLGDLVGYGANPNETIEICSELCDNIVVGNHDLYASGDSLENLVFHANVYKSLIWTRQVINKKNVEYLKTLKYTHNENNILFTHSNPAMPDYMIYIYSARDAEMFLRDCQYATTFIGHSHTPVDHHTKHGRLINAGSVGQPRDGDPRATYTLYREDTGERKVVRVEYDIESARQAILDAELPTFHAQRLTEGR